MTRRSAYTLVEMLVVIALCSVLACLAALCLKGFYDFENATKDRVEYSRGIRRFSVQFRCDAHDALSAAVGDDAGQAPMLVLTLADDRQVEYHSESAQVSRRVRQDGSQIHYDAFLLPDAESTRFSVDDDGMVHVWIQCGTLQSEADHLMAKMGGER